MEESNDGTLELRTTASVDSGWGESPPDNRLADVGGNEKGDTGTETIALLEEFVQKNDDQGGSQELDDQENADTRTKIRWWAVKSSEHVDASLTEREDDGKELLRGLVELTVGLEVKVDVDEVSAGKKLENHSRRDDGRDTQFHKRSTVTGHHHTEPVKRIGGVWYLVKIQCPMLFARFGSAHLMTQCRTVASGS